MEKGNCLKKLSYAFMKNKKFRLFSFFKYLNVRKKRVNKMLKMITNTTKIKNHLFESKIKSILIVILLLSLFVACC